MKHDIFIHNNIPSLELEREAYRGGRCECFFIGKPPSDEYYYLDVNSMYPYVMSRFDYPRKLIKHYKVMDLGLLKWALRRFAVIARLKVQLNEPGLGIYRDKLIFPVGSFVGSFTSPEISYILEYGKILDYGPMSIYDKAPIFREFVKYFYDKRLYYREQGDGVSDQFAKLCMNSLYGKFGQRSRKTLPAAWSPPCQGRYFQFLDLKSKERSIYVKIGDQWFIESTFDEAYNALVAVPAFVTSYARMYLWQIMKQAGIENVFYVDTDSVFVNQLGKDNLESIISSEKELGYLGLKTHNSKLEIHGAKMYQFGEDIRIKGISRPEGFKKEYQQTRFLKLRSALRAGVEGGVRQIDLKKVLSYNYSKGNVSPSGVVSPLTLFEV